MSSKLSFAKNCQFFNEAHAWDWGLGGGSAWVQYIDKSNNTPILSVMRNPANGALRIHWHNASAADDSNLQSAAYAKFEFASGSGSSTIAVEGIGILQKSPDGNVSFDIGNLEYPDPTALELFARVNQRARNSLRMYINEVCYKIPLTKAAKVALRIVFSSQANFNKTALRLNMVRDKQLSVEEFARH